MGNIAYDRESTRQIKFKFNLKTDADILAHLDSQQNKQGYIKQLIRADIAAHAGANPMRVCDAEQRSQQGP